MEGPIIYPQQLSWAETDRRTDRHTERQTDRQTDRQIEIVREIEIETDRQDKYGHDLSDNQLMDCVDHDWLLDGNFHMNLFDEGSQKWLAWRHPENDRGDEATELKRQASCESVGRLPGIR